MTRVVPAILTDDFQALEEMVRQAERFITYAQIDIMDGKFVPSSSITWREIEKVKPSFQWEAHLMVKKPGDQFEAYKQAGARRVIFHFEAAKTPADLIEQARSLKLEVGLAVNPETPLSAFAALAKKVDEVLFLSVNPGFYGAPFIPEVLDKLKEFRKSKPKAEIGIDGGIKESNIVQVAACGADVIHVGSAIFRHENPEEAYHRLTALVERMSP